MTEKNKTKEINKTKEGLFKKINLIESITILENGSSYTEFNRCYCSEDLAYIRQEYAKAKRLSKKGEKLVYIPERHRFQEVASYDCRNARVDQHKSKQKNENKNN